jgi:hypothetical protein
MLFTPSGCASDRRSGFALNCGIGILQWRRCAISIALKRLRGADSWPSLLQAS